MTVLILAAEFDVSADQMVLTLRDRAVPVYRVDTMWFPTQLSIEAQLRGVSATTHQFQRWVAKKYDARVIAIGSRLFAFAIHAGNTESSIDFRTDYDALSYEPLELPPEVSEGIRRFLDAMGLVYGALDFVVGPEGEFTFLECNAGGQFGWLEARTGAPLTGVLADLLAVGAPS